ncbi:DUF6003 family protein [Streptomyces sp. NPDC088097]|uniref:DUF6003 family protein n=1 Tax=Streptomyces sp. NPDC088097 TaxID=3365823 RepID=UPI00382ECFEE
MTEDAYLFLAVTAGRWPGTPLALVGELACLGTPAVLGWFGAQGVDAGSPSVRVVPPEQTDLIPKDAERLPVPLSPEELERVRHAGATDPVALAEEELLAFRDAEESRDTLLRRALAAGVPIQRIVELSGVDPDALSALAAPAPTSR